MLVSEGRKDRGLGGKTHERREEEEAQIPWTVSCWYEYGRADVTCDPLGVVSFFFLASWRFVMDKIVSY